MSNPYTDLPTSELFYGREELLTPLVEAMNSGRRAIAAVTGGRGMGKSSLSRKLEQRLDPFADVFTVRIDHPGSTAAAFTRQLSQKLGHPIDPDDIEGSLLSKLRQPSEPRLVLIIDEIEAVLREDFGIPLLENLRIAYQNAGRRLGIVILGGSMLRVLLSSDASAFLRSAQWLPLRGLSHEECKQMLCEPLGISLDPVLCELVWNDTNGHPLLLQRIMEEAVKRRDARDAPLEPEILAVMARRTDASLDRTLFQEWWDNLEDRGREIFRRLMRRGTPLPESEALVALGDRFPEWVEVLETTGVARFEDNVIVPRGEQFRRWFAANYTDRPSPVPSRESSVWQTIAASEFERAVIDAVGRWTGYLVETTGYHLRTGRTGNHRLQLEEYFQISLMCALSQYPWIVDAESLSVKKAGRCDVKIRLDRDGPRACGEIKRWAIGNREHYTGIVEQVLGHTLARDTFAFTVSLDCGTTPLLERYYEDCGLAANKTLYRDDTTSLPLLVTEHARPPHAPIRVYHFLVQLPVG